MKYFTKASRKVLLSLLFHLAFWKRRKSVFPPCCPSSPLLQGFLRQSYDSWQQNATADNLVSGILVFVGFTLALNTRAHCPLQIWSVSGRQTLGVLQGSSLRRRNLHSDVLGIFWVCTQNFLTVSFKQSDEWRQTIPMPRCPMSGHHAPFNVYLWQVNVV